MLRFSRSATSSLTRAFSTSPPFSKVMAANRGEIAVRILRAANELGCNTVGIYSFEDRNTPVPMKADQSFRVGKGLTPLQAYLDIDGIVEVAKANGVEAVHPGYGFLSENPAFNKKLEEAGIRFVGPTVKNLIEFGDKTQARQLARASNVPVVPGTENAVTTVEEAKAFTNEHGFPIIIKAAHGGGGKGMRVVREESELRENMEMAMSEALSSFGNGEVFLERYVERPRHIEIQVIGDGTGNVVHLYDRDCSVQRRHQKVLETAPAIHIDPAVRQAMFDDAVRLTSAANYRNAGTVEFLLDAEGRHYFIEVNPRVQVEHTVTEEVTGIDIVQTQLRIASGATLADVGIPNQESVQCLAHAMQCRVTTEDATNDFAPATGKLEVFRTPGGGGIRVDDGIGFQGGEVTPYYDSMLVKLTGRGRSREDVAKKLQRALAEFRIRGVTTNIPFLQGLLSHPEFVHGTPTTAFIEENPALTQGSTWYESQNRAQKLLSFLGNTVVNGCPGDLGANLEIGTIPDDLIPKIPTISEPSGAERENSLRSVYVSQGPEAFARAVRNNKSTLLMDTTWRDAHQSLLATRVRTRDIAAIAPATANAFHNFYSLENWGGATFDVCMRFLKECPWDRLETLRELVPDVPFQMLLRGANGVGYTSYPDNCVHKFCDVAVKSGMDVFRIFDSLNYVPNLHLGIDAVGTAGGIVEAAVCYTGDILRDEPGYKYNLEYYLDLTRQLVDLGIHVLAIKDMAGLLKPEAATKLISAIRAEHPDLPIHLHMHDTAGIGVASYLAAVRAGADVVDVATDALSGMTSQPSLGAIVASLKNTELDTGVDFGNMTQINDYWEQMRAIYAPFESGQKSGSSDVFEHEIPGGQYTNLLFQANQLKIADQWPAIKKKYAEANEVCGDIVKVTPSSKVVGDLAQFMTQNDLSKEDVIRDAETLSFPGSVVDFFAGGLGIPAGGFDEDLRKKVVKDSPIFEDRPGAELPAFDFDAARSELEARDGAPVSDQDLMSHVMYPDVYKDYREHVRQYGNVSILPTRAFVMGLAVNEEAEFQLESGKTLYVKLDAIGNLDEDGMRRLFFRLNGQPRVIKTFDHTSDAEVEVKEKATSEPGSVGASMTGSVVEICAQEGDVVDVGDILLKSNAMKMEISITAPIGGTVKRVTVKQGDQIDAGDLVAEIE